MVDRMNDLDAFEQSVRASLDQYEVPYNSADWNAMERNLNGAGKGWWLSGAGLIAALIVGTLLVGGSAWYFVSNNDVNKGGTAQGSPSSNDNQQAPADTQGRSATQATDPNTANVPETASTTAPNEATDAASANTTLNTTGTSANKHTDKAGKTDKMGTAPTTTEASKGNKPENSGYNANSSATSSSSDSKSTETAFRASVNQGCPGTAVEFKVEHMPEKGIYLWNFGDGSFSNKANPEHTFTKPGRYQVMLSMSAEGVGAIHNKPSSDVIVIHEAPRAAFNVVKQEYEGHLPSVHFENRSTAAKSYRWNFADGGTSTVAHPDHIFKKKGVYPVELTVTNEIGCTHTLVKEVRIDKDYNLDAAMSFSPNGDGKDESFIPEALRSLGAKFQMTIYNGNGEVVYQTSDATKPWLGRLNNRTDACPVGEYVWVVDVKESIHLAETYTGNVKLIR
jgi:gliding motility-associated-like protein